MYPNLTSAPQCWQNRTVKPTAKLVAAFFVFYLFIIFEVVAHDKSWAHASPFPTSHLLSATTCQDTELVPILELDNNLCLGVSGETFNFEVTDQLLIFRQLSGDVAQVFNRKLFVRGDENDVALNLKKRGGENEDVGEGAALGVARRSDDAGLCRVGV